MKSNHITSIKSLATLIVVAAMAALSTLSCSEADTNYHKFGATSAINGGSIVYAYADQTGDTLYIESTDSWKGRTLQDWLIFTSTGTQTESKTVKYEFNKVTTFKVPITIKANTTNAMRASAIQFDANKHTAGIQYQQAYWINVTNPAPKFANETTFAGLQLVKEVGSSDTSTTIEFVLHNDATITSDADWARPDTKDFKKGVGTATITLDPNVGGTKRDAHITINSASGAKTTVTLRQN